MSLRIEVCKNCRGSWDVREGDIEGSESVSNLTKKQVLIQIKEWIDKEGLKKRS